MHGTITHGHGNNLTPWMEGQSKACMLGIKNNASMARKVGMGHNSTWKEGNGWSSITAGTSYKGMGVLKCGSMHDIKLSMYACMYENKPIRAMCHVKGGLGQPLPPKSKVNMGPSPPQEEKRGSSPSLSYF